MENIKDRSFKLYPLDPKEYIGTINVNDNLAPPGSESAQIIIILDKSGSMGDIARRVSNEIIPLFLTKLFYKATDVIHFITFDGMAQRFKLTVENLKSLAIFGNGQTKMAPAVSACSTVFNELNSDKPVRVLTISDGLIQDQKQTDEAAAYLVNFLRFHHFSINSQAVRLFTSNDQPDTKALCSLLQLNNTTTPKLVDISTMESNESIAAKMEHLFKNDNLASGQLLTTDEQVLKKYPWESSASSQLTLMPGENKFWLMGVPSHDFKIGDASLNFALESPLTLPQFHALMDDKLDDIVNHMKILKVIDTAESNETVKTMVKYFDQKETSLAQKSPFAKFDLIHSKKISGLLSVIAEDDSVKNFDSAKKASYLQQNNLNPASQDPFLQSQSRQPNFSDLSAIGARFAAIPNIGQTINLFNQLVAKLEATNSQISQVQILMEFYCPQYGVSQQNPSLVCPSDIARFC